MWVAHQELREERASPPADVADHARFAERKELGDERRDGDGDAHHRVSEVLALVRVPVEPRPDGLAQHPLEGALPRLQGPLEIAPGREVRDRSEVLGPLAPPRPPAAHEAPGEAVVLEPAIRPEREDAAAGEPPERAVRRVRVRVRSDPRGDLVGGEGPGREHVGDPVAGHRRQRHRVNHACRPFEQRDLDGHHRIRHVEHQSPQLERRADHEPGWHTRQPLAREGPIEQRRRRDRAPDERRLEGAARSVLLRGERAH